MADGRPGGARRARGVLARIFLTLAGEDYDVAWCMQGDLEVEARGMGQGAGFQRTMERLPDQCRASYARDGRQ